MPTLATASPTDRRTRRRLRDRSAILSAAASVMSEKGIDEATMAEISERADVALGSLYNHFGSKESLAVAVVDVEIEQVAKHIVERTTDFEDPALVFAYGNRTVMEHATTNDRWRRLLDSPEVIADRFHHGFGPYATNDIRLAVDAGRFQTTDVDLAWRLVTWAIVGASKAVCAGEIEPAALADAQVAILGIVGLGCVEARQLVELLPSASTPIGGPAPTT